MMDLIKMAEQGARTLSSSKRKEPATAFAYGTIQSVENGYAKVYVNGGTLENVPMVSGTEWARPSTRCIVMTIGRLSTVVSLISSPMELDMAPYLSEDFQPYTSDKESWNYPKIYIAGGFVTVSGALKPAKAIESSTAETLMATLPEIARPRYRVIRRCQGSSISTWALSITTDGNMSLSRYGTTSYETITTDNWLPFYETYPL